MGEGGGDPESWVRGESTKHVHPHLRRNKRTPNNEASFATFKVAEVIIITVKIIPSAAEEVVGRIAQCSWDTHR